MQADRRQDHEIPRLYYGFLGVHLAVLQCARELVLCGELVERWWHDCHTATGNSVSFCVCLGTSEGEGEAKDCVKTKMTPWKESAESTAESCSPLFCTYTKSYHQLENWRALRTCCQAASLTMSESRLCLSWRDLYDGNTRNPIRAIGSQETRPSVQESRNVSGINRETR